MGKREFLRILENEEELEVDLNSKIVFISDVHRGDGGYNDSLMNNKNIYLAAIKYYYNEGYTLIEIGDGDELWENRNCIDIAYNYKEVFDLYNKFNNDKSSGKKRLYMIYGNHDNIKKNKNFKKYNENKFRKIDENFGESFLKLINNIEFHEGIVLNFSLNSKKIKKKCIVTHGHQLDLMNNEFSFVSRFLVRYIWTFLEGIAGYKAPNSPANSYKKGSKIDKKLADWANENKTLLICGHTHNVKFPKVGEGLYFNDGSCVLPHSITCLEINEGSIVPIKWSIDVRGKCNSCKENKSCSCKENKSCEKNKLWEKNKPCVENNLFVKRDKLDKAQKLEEYLKFVK